MWLGPSGILGVLYLEQWNSAVT